MNPDTEPISGENNDSGESLAGRYMLLRAIFIKQMTLTLRYRINFGLQIVGLYVFFAIIFFGGRATVTQTDGGMDAFSGTFEGLIVGWFLWTMAQVAYHGLQHDITTESEWGTLEQLYMSSFGFRAVLGSQIIVNVFMSFFWGFLILILMLVTTQVWLDLSILTIIPILLLALLSVIGLGFFIAGLALVYKKVDSIDMLMQLVLAVLIATPATNLSFVNFLPLAQGSAMLQDTMRDGVALWEFSLQDLSLLLGTGLGYFLFGYLVFTYAETVARRRGVMGHY